MRMKHRTRREFLLHSSAALTGIAAASPLFAQIPGNPANTSGASPRLRGLMVDAGRVPESLDD
jgi:hypothetical protein